MLPMTRFSKNSSPPAGEIQESGSSTAQKSDIMWSGDARICSKQLKHYHAFVRSGTTVPICSFVFVKSEEKTEDLGYVEDLYEDQKGEKMVRVRWFYFRMEMETRIPNLDAQANEVFITANEQVISAESIDGIATVLTPDHFEKCLGVLPRELSFGWFVCHKEYRKQKFKAFHLSELRGYTTQPILSSLICHLPWRRNNKQKSTETGEGSAPRKPEGLGLTTLEDGKTCPTSEVSNDQVAVDTKFVASEPQCQLLFNVNEKIEVLSQDSGLRGCWFRCKIMHSSHKFLKVQYYDVLDVEGRKLEERLPSPEVANSDKLGMRCDRRPTIRPWPCEDISDPTFKVGAAVDAWWCNGWWEGVVFGCHTSEEKIFQVYFPGENKFSSVERKNLRASKDWVDSKWIDIKEKPDILSLISSIWNPTPKLRPVPTFNEPTTSSARTKGKHCSSQRAEMAEDAKSAEENAIQKLYFKKRLQIRYNEDMNCSNSGNAANNYTNSDKRLKIKL